MSNGGGIRAGIRKFLFSGDPKHVAIGLVIVGTVATIPWYIFTKDAKHQSHGDYMDRAEQARRERLSSSGAKTS